MSGRKFYTIQGLFYSFPRRSVALLVSRCLDQCKTCFFLLFWLTFQLTTMNRLNQARGKSSGEFQCPKSGKSLAKRFD